MGLQVRQRGDRQQHYLDGGYVRERMHGALVLQDTGLARDTDHVTFGTRIVSKPRYTGGPYKGASPTLEQRGQDLDEKNGKDSPE